jgi:hypothetical protein
MNQRIQELANHAELYVDLYGKPWPRAMSAEEADAAYKKFAELIVLECAGLFPNVYVSIQTEYGHTPVIAEDYIKKHFGIK